ncbi:signal peptidase SipW, required for TasA secretion [Lachnospiraceae bacterium KM106-2]|nr:signal peptidase SipW, required for TasA secretion [Lachnospiraceae bacterium KM106-2]
MAVVGVLVVLLVPRVFGYETYAVLSGSMEPTYHVGSIVYVDKISVDKIKLKDPVAFRLDKDTVATHRVIKIDKEKKLIYTKGDANNVADQRPVPFANVIGKATVSIDRLGFLATNIKTKRGILTGVFILLFVLLLYLIPEILKKPKEEAVAGTEKITEKEEVGVEEEKTSEHVSI